MTWRPYENDLGESQHSLDSTLCPVQLKVAGALPSELEFAGWVGAPGPTGVQIQVAVSVVSEECVRAVRARARAVIIAGAVVLPA